MAHRDPHRIEQAARAGIAVMVAAQLAHLGGSLAGHGETAVVGIWLYHLIGFVALVLAVARVVVVPEGRAAWALLAGYIACTNAGDVTWTLMAEDGWVAPGQLPDLFYYAAYPAGYAGVVLLLRGRSGGWFTPAMWLDGVIGGLSLAAVTAAVVLTPVLATQDGTAFEVAVNIGYVVCDILLLTFVGLAAGLAGWRPGRSWTLIGAGLAATAVVDGIFTYAEATGTFSPASAFSTLWPAGLALLAIAAWQPRRRVVVREAGPVAGAVMPAIFAAMALTVLGVAHWHEVTDLGVILALITLVAVAIRGALTFRENARLLERSRREATTDALTGLRNRRRLMEDLDETLAAARAGHPATLVFFDLDGFKAYNDSFGHNAGDALLQRLGGALRDAVSAEGSAYRLGGDEFCVLAPAARGAGDPLVVRAATALTEQGEGFTIAPSLGLVTLPEEASTSTLALQLADERMYAQKGTRRASAQRQTRDLLLQLLGEREPALREHMDHVAALATGTARELGLEGEDVDETARAAELHDIGKVAIPDSVLHKPAALDEGEWALMRQHTLIGERILLAAPALRPVAALVRASHERWDGGGYPDGLAGEAIPLGSRIVAVCDAFDAMTADRSYRAAMPAEDALAELRRCAGRQFDPAVVAAFEAVWRAERSALPRAA